MHVYCLYCQTQRCKTIANLLQIQGIQRAFAPQIMQKQRKEGKNETIFRDLLPGYVFFFHDEPLESYQLYEHSINGIVRRIGRADEEYELHGPDREFALNLYEKNGLVGTMKIVKIGETVTLDDPLFNNCQGKITAIDYRKERARVDFVFNNTACHTWIAIESVKGE